MNIYLDLFLTFAKIGAMTFGGGIAMLPMLERELVNNKGWITEEEILDYFAVGQCTPGIIAVNVATFVGQKKKKIPGGICATLGMVFPCLVIIDLIAAVLSSFMYIPAVQSAFAGIRICVCVLVLNAFVKLARKSVADTFGKIVLAAVAACSLFIDVNPVVFVIAAAFAGILVRNLQAKEVKK